MIPGFNITDSLRTSIGAVLHQRGIPNATALAEELARNAAMPIMLLTEGVTEELADAHAMIADAFRTAWADGEVPLVSLNREIRAAAIRAALKAYRDAVDAMLEASELPGVGGCPLCNLDAAEYIAPLKAAHDHAKELLK